MENRIGSGAWWKQRAKDHNVQEARLQEIRREKRIQELGEVLGTSFHDLAENQHSEDYQEKLEVFSKDIAIIRLEAFQSNDIESMQLAEKAHMRYAEYLFLRQASLRQKQ